LIIRTNERKKEDDERWSAQHPAEYEALHWTHVTHVTAINGICNVLRPRAAFTRSIALYAITDHWNHMITSTYNRSTRCCRCRCSCQISSQR